MKLLIDGHKFKRSKQTLPAKSINLLDDVRISWQHLAAMTQADVDENCSKYRNTSNNVPPLMIPAPKKF